MAALALSESTMAKTKAMRVIDSSMPESLWAPYGEKRQRRSGPRRSTGRLRTDGAQRERFAFKADRQQARRRDHDGAAGVFGMHRQQSVGAAVPHLAGRPE